MGVGVVFGCVMVFNPMLTVRNIGEHLIDGNLRRAVSPVAGIGGMIFGRVLDVLVVGLMIFVVALTNWSVVLVFPLAAFRGYCLVMNLYWAFFKFGMPHGLILFVVYLFWLLVAVVLFVIAVVFIMRHCAGIRRYGFKTGIRWREFCKGLLVICCAAAVVGFFEWLVYFLVLSRMVFLV